MLWASGVGGGNGWLMQKEAKVRGWGAVEWAFIISLHLMKHSLFIWVYVLALWMAGTDALLAQRPGGASRGDRGGFSLSNLSSSKKNIPDSLLAGDSTALTAKRLTGYRLTPILGERYVAPMDTGRLNFANSTLVEAKSLAVGYLANLGSPAQTRMFSERKEERDFIFADAYDYYITTPENAYFYDTKVPYTNVMYTTGGASQSKAEQLKGVLTMNFGPRINVGGEIDYIYSRGHYDSNGNKLLSYRFFGSYRSDRYEANAFVSNFNFVNFENGGLTNDLYITNPDDFDQNKRQTDPKAFPVRFTDTWNRVRGKQYFLTHRYNLGFYREMTAWEKEAAAKEREAAEKRNRNAAHDVQAAGGTPAAPEGQPAPDVEEEEDRVFVPVSSIIHTIDYEDNRRRFLSEDPYIDTCYQHVFGMDSALNDLTSAWKLRNTVALSLREGFQDWVKFGLTGYVTFEKRRFRLPAAVPGLDYPDLSGGGDGSETDPAALAAARRTASRIAARSQSGVEVKIPDRLDFQLADTYDEFSTYVGAELYKRQGSLLTFNARGELCIAGSDFGEFRVNGDLQTRFPLLGKEALIRAEASIKNTTPPFYQRHYHGRYFWWDKDLSMVQHFYAGAKIDLESTRTQLSGGVESIQNFVYFNSRSYPEQYSRNLQVISLRLKQDVKYRAFGWENEAAYQLSSNKDVLPLPALSVYSNMYLVFKLAKVLTVQVGANVYYNTAYYAPYYEPASQQFRLQDEENRVKVGNYPLINAYVNFHLKQARFFVMGYNLSQKFVSPNYFSLAHYPLDPMVLKMGIAVTFNN